MDEFDLISRHLRKIASTEGALGLGDDVARLTVREAAIVTTDCLVEGVHFLPQDPIGTIARKLVRVNVSDIHAKGALPGEALLVLGWPKDRAESELVAFVEALGDDLGLWGANLIGGDTVSTHGPLFLSLTLTGKALGVSPVWRAGAHAGEDLWVTGRIGAGWCGLREVLAEVSGPDAEHYRTPALPGPGAARLVAAHASASMDVSDGLLGDAAKLAEASGVGLNIDLEAMPLAQPDTAVMDQITHGDDYQILFTAPVSNREALLAQAGQEGLKVTRIGEVTAGRELRLLSNGNPVPLPQKLGFAHE
ncbi:MAG: thiamine-phosphate kinase [Hyphomonadaceae bacterium]|nr:thiamine-phosphate kinase [Hyphomonadaceae bacterium]